MHKNMITIFIGALLSLVLALGGSLLAWLLLVGSTQSSSNKGALVTFMLVQSFVVNPLMAVIVGVFVGWFGQRTWSLVAVSLLPLLAYGVVKGRSDQAEILLSIGYLVLGLLSACGAAQIRRKVSFRRRMSNHLLQRSAG